MTLKEFYRIYDKQISAKIHDALKEDTADNDITSRILISKNLPVNKKVTAELLCNENCVLAGLDIMKRAFLEVDRRIIFKQFYNDGEKVFRGEVIMKINGSWFNILRTERTALNFIQRMSGIATLTSRFVRQLKHKNAKILHTRKTTPNFRLFEAAAVKIGGGDFHRLSLNSAVLIKDNHIQAAGSIRNVIKSLHKKNLVQKMKGRIEIEVKSLNELKEMTANLSSRLIKIIMLDNFSLYDLPEAAQILKSKGFKIEFSGGINEKNFRQIQHKDIDYYSIGMLTHSYKSINFSLEL